MMATFRMFFIFASSVKNRLLRLDKYNTEGIAQWKRRVLGVCSRVLLGIQYQAKTNAMIAVSRRPGFSVCRPEIAFAKVPSPTFDHLIIAVFWSFRIIRGAARKIIVLVPVGDPLPDVTGSVIETICVRCQRTDGSGLAMTVNRFLRIFVFPAMFAIEVSVFSGAVQLVAPEPIRDCSAASRLFPFCLSR